MKISTEKKFVFVISVKRFLSNHMTIKTWAQLFKSAASLGSHKEYRKQVLKNRDKR